jgi:hypothetical protein
MRWLLLLIVIAGVAAYFTRPAESVMRERAEAVLSEPSNLREGFESIGAAIAGERQYANYYVVSKYTVTLDGEPLVTCWGAFQQVQCDRASETPEPAATP